MSNIRIQTFRQEYQEQVIALISNIQRNEFNISITPDEQPDLKNIPGFYQKNKGNFWLAFNEEEVVGTIALLDISNSQAALRKMFVKEEYRRKGTGTAKALLETVLSWAGVQRIEEIYLGTTPAFLAAHRFYEKNGFAEISESELPEKFPIMKVDTKFYKFSLCTGQKNTRKETRLFHRT